MTQRTRQIMTTLLAVAVLSVAGIPQIVTPAVEGLPMPRTLLIDETRTFASTMRVGALAGVLRQAGVDLEVRLDAVLTTYVDPLDGAGSPDAPFDLILIVPVGIEVGTVGTVGEVWMLYGHAAAASDDAQARLEPLRDLLAVVFEGIAAPVGVLDDLWVAGLASLYEAEGWLR